MRMRLPGLIVVALLVPSEGRADDHKADFFAAVSFAKGTTIGGNVSGALALGAFSDWAASREAVRRHDESDREKSRMRYLSLVVDYGALAGRIDGEAASRRATMAGLRYTIPWTMGGSNHRIFVQGLAAVVRNNIGPAPSTNGGGAIAGGIELRNETPQSTGGGFRVQVERIFVSGTPTSFWRFAVGPVFRLGHE